MGVPTGSIQRERGRPAGSDGGEVVRSIVDSPRLDTPVGRKVVPVDVAVKECTFPTNREHRFAAESVNDQAFCPEALGREMADMEAEGMKCNLETDHVVVDGDLKTILTLTCTGRSHEARPKTSPGGGVPNAGSRPVGK